MWFNSPLLSLILYLYVHTKHEVKVWTDTEEAVMRLKRKETYQDTIELIQEEQLTESKLKMVIISGFRTCWCHLANAAKVYKSANTK